MYEIINLNGLTLIFSPFRGMETASIGIFTRAGARYENAKVKGVSHFLEHLLFKGSRRYPYRRIKREIEGRGGTLNGFTSQEITGYYAHFLSKNANLTLDILLDMVCNPLLKPQDIAKERKVVLEEIKMYNDLPSSRVVMLMDGLLWKSHPLGEEVIGTNDTVNRIGRDDMAHFKNAYYRPANMVISCCGDIQIDEVTRLLKEKIGAGGHACQLRTNPPSALRNVRVAVESKQLEQTHLCVGFRSVSYRHRERITAELLNVILGANMSSRLFESMREQRALCYDVSTEVRKYKDSGAFVVHVGLDKSKIAVALRTIFGELERLRTKDVGGKELERTKDYLLGQVTMGLERPQGRMFYLAESYLNLGSILQLEEIKQEIAAIDANRIRRFAGDIFNFHNACVACVGNIKPDIEDKIGKIVKEAS